MKSVLVGGIVPLTTLDYPEFLASIVFLQGCSWRCKYCHNPHLQSLLPKECLPWEDILNVLKTREGFVEAVIFSGGEPLLQAQLVGAIKDVKNMGFKVGVHTAGGFPEMLARVIPVVDWIGFDIKYRFKDYQWITTVKDSGIAALKSLKLLIASDVTFEVRMTAYKPIETSVIVEVLKELSVLGVKKVVLQKCRDKDENIVEHPIFSDKLLIEDISKCFNNFSVRE